MKKKKDKVQSLINEVSALIFTLVITSLIGFGIWFLSSEADLVTRLFVAFLMSNIFAVLLSPLILRWAMESNETKI